MPVVRYTFLAIVPHYCTDRQVAVTRQDMSNAQAKTGKKKKTASQ